MIIYMDGKGNGYPLTSSEQVSSKDRDQVSPRKNVSNVLFCVNLAWAGHEAKKVKVPFGIGVYYVGAFIAFHPSHPIVTKALRVAPRNGHPHKNIHDPKPSHQAGIATCMDCIGFFFVGYRPFNQSSCANPRV